LNKTDWIGVLGHRPRACAQGRRQRELLGELEQLEPDVRVAPVRGVQKADHPVEPLLHSPLCVEEDAASVLGLIASEEVEDVESPSVLGDDGAVGLGVGVTVLDEVGPADDVGLASLLVTGDVATREPRDGQVTLSGFVEDDRDAREAGEALGLGIERDAVGVGLGPCLGQ